MAIIGAIFAALSRAFGRIANMALGWATVLLFGRVPESKRLLLSLVTLGSIAWVAALVGVLLPDVGAILLAAVPQPEFVEEAWVRLAMLVVALVLPPIIGVGTLFLLDPAERPSGRGLVTQVLRGYPYAAVLAVTLVFLAVIAAGRKAMSLVRRWGAASVPMLVKPGAYEAVVRDLETALDDAGLDMTRAKAPVVLTIPPRLLALVGGAGVRRLVPDDLVLLKRDDLEVLVYPSDASLIGSRRSLARGRAAIAARLTFTEAYLTASAEGQEIEDQVAELSRSGSASEADFRELDRRLAELVVPFEEWDALYRLRLQVETHVRARAMGVVASEPGTGSAPLLPAPRLTTRVGSAGAVQWLIAAVSILLPAIDITLALLGSRRHSRRR